MNMCRCSALLVLQDWLQNMCNLEGVGGEATHEARGGDDPWEEVRDPICSRMWPIFPPLLLGQWQILHPKLYQDTPLHWMISTMQWRAVEAKFIFSEKSNEIGCWYVAPRSNLVNLGQGIDLKLYLDTATTWHMPGISATPQSSLRLNFYLTNCSISTLNKYSFFLLLKLVSSGG